MGDEDITTLFHLRYVALLGVVIELVTSETILSHRLFDGVVTRSYGFECPFGFFYVSSRVVALSFNFLLGNVVVKDEVVDRCNSHTKVSRYIFGCTSFGNGSFGSFLGKVGIDVSFAPIGFPSVIGPRDILLLSYCKESGTRNVVSIAYLVCRV